MHGVLVSLYDVKDDTGECQVAVVVKGQMRPYVYMQPPIRANNTTRDNFGLGN